MSQNTSAANAEPVDTGRNYELLGSALALRLRTRTPAELERMFYLAGNYRVSNAFHIADQMELFQDGMGGIETHIKEGAGCMPGEDFLCEEVAELRDFAKKSKGERKQDLTTLIDRIEAKLTEQAQSGDYAADEFRKALKIAAGR